MTDQQKSEEEKAKQAWIDLHKGLDYIQGREDFKPSLKRDIEKRISEHRKYYNLFNRREEDAHIQELQYFLELIETVEP